MSDSPEVVLNPEASRFEVTIDGHTAELVYRLDGDRLVLLHTGVPDELEGRGIGGRLVSAAVDEAEARQHTLVPECSFARSWLERHPDAAAKVTVEAPGA
jgi:predicted GNAT family acetyltransferase